MRDTEENFPNEDLDYGVEDFELLPSKDYIHLGRMGVPTQEFDGQLLKLDSPYDEASNTQARNQEVSALHAALSKATSAKGHSTFTRTREQENLYLERMKICDQHLPNLNSEPVQFPRYGLYGRQDYETINTTPLKPDMHDSTPLVETPREIIQKNPNSHRGKRYFLENGMQSENSLGLNASCGKNQLKFKKLKLTTKLSSLRSLAVKLNTFAFPKNR